MGIGRTARHSVRHFNCWITRHMWTGSKRSPGNRWQSLSRSSVTVPRFPGDYFQVTSSDSMISILETITKRLAEAWRSDEPTGRGHSHRCQCGRPVFFRNSLCLGCRTALGYEPELAKLLPLQPGAEAGTWIVHGQKEPTPQWRNCENFDGPSG